MASSARNAAIAPGKSFRFSSIRHWPFRKLTSGTVALASSALRISGIACAQSPSLAYIIARKTWASAEPSRSTRSMAACASAERPSARSAMPSRYDTARSGAARAASGCRISIARAFWPRRKRQSARRSAAASFSGCAARTFSVSSAASVKRPAL